jgi:hypothetical protein
VVESGWINADILVTGTFGTPTGTAQLILDGTTVLSTEGLQGNGEGYYYIPNGTLSAGTHTLTAVYSGNGQYTTATSAPVTIIVAPPRPPVWDFTSFDRKQMRPRAANAGVARAIDLSFIRST